MKQKIFAVYDSKAEAFNTPIFAQSTGVAIRSFAQAANDQTHDFARYGGDFSLFELGEFDLASGHITMLKTHINLGLAITFVESTPDPRQLSIAE